jgi:peptidoglycan/LPS O-acetylase OafA/YrhL
MKQHIPQLDGLRAVACLLVLGDHLWRYPAGAPILNSLFVSGWVGVDLFFVLSGFLITGILVDTRESAHYWRDFYVRRALRILPLNYALLAFVLGVMPLVSHYPGVVQARQDALWYLLYCANFVAAWGRAGFLMISITWSLAIEEQFYLVWPILVRWLTPRHMANICIALIVGLPILRVSLFPTIGDAWCIFATPLRADAFAWGAILALSRGFWSKRVVWAVLILGLATILPFALTENFRRELPWVATVGFTLAEMCAAAALWLTIHSRSRILASRPMRYIGKISYGMYMLHVPCGTLVSRFYEGNGLLGSWLFMLISSALTVLVAGLSFRFFETPFLRLKDRFSSSSGARTGVAAAA